MNRDLHWKYSKALQELIKERNQLKQELKDKDNKINVLEKQRNNYRHKRNEYRKTINQLKQQLAEKEKEIERLKELNLDIPIQQMQFHHNQDKISFAVEQINKLKNDLDNNDNIIIRYCDFEEIDNIFEKRITEITHQHEDKGE